MKTILYSNSIFVLTNNGIIELARNKDNNIQFLRKKYYGLKVNIFLSLLLFHISILFYTVFLILNYDY